MANWAVPFANDGDKRLPDPTEKALGFGCGAADQTLFNMLFHRIEAELGDLVQFAGIAGSDADNTTVRQAVLALIEAATGGGDPSTYLLMSQARGRLPIFPEVQTSDGRIIVTAPATGSVRIPGGVTFMHRGIFPVTTTQTDFATTASQTYHLRWDPTNGYRLLNLANVAYNPSGDPEDAERFDSTYDDILFARIVTNSSNVADITNLSNKTRIVTDFSAPGVTGVGGRTLVHPINFARRGIATLQDIIPPGGNRDSDPWITVQKNTRYAVTVYSWGWQANVPNEQMSAFGYKYNVLAA